MKPPNSIAGRLGSTAIAVLEHRAFLPLCVFLHVALRLLVVYGAPVEPTSDAEWYFNRAVTLAETGSYQRPNGELTAFWPVGYIGYMAGLFKMFGTELVVAKLGNVLLSLLSALAIYRMGRIIVGERAARIATVAYALYPNAIAYSAVIWSENLFSTCLLLGAWAFVAANSIRNMVIAGFFFGIGTLTKAQGAPVPFLLAGFAYLFVRSRRMQTRTLLHGAVLCIATAATVAPWTIRNYGVFGEAVTVSTNGGIAFLASNNSSLKPDFRSNHNQDDPLIHSTGHPTAPELEVDKKARELGIQWIKDHPWDFTLLIPHKIFRLWVPCGESEWAWQADIESYTANRSLFRTLRWLNQFYYLAMLGLAVLVFPWMYAKDRLAGPKTRWVWASFVISVYFTFVSIIFSGQSRYRAPFFPFVMLNAAVVAASILSRGERSEDAEQHALPRH